MKLQNLTEKDMKRLNADLTNKIYKTFEIPEVDLVQINPNWVKLHFVANDSTYIIKRENIKQIPRDLVAVPTDLIDKPKLVVPKVVNNEIFNLQEIVDALFKNISDLLYGITDVYVLNGMLTNINDILFRPFDNAGEIFTGEYEKRIIDGKPYCLKKTIIHNVTGEWESLEVPLAWRGECLNIGKKLSGSNAVAPARLIDLDEENVPLYNIDKMLGYQDRLTVNEDIGALHPCAQRRMKLFDAAHHLGSRLIEDGSWIAAVCFEYPQCHVFGRLKPKVLPGTNEINPDCNLEDWEGITPENKAIRDDWSADWIHDGIDDGHGHSFDKLSGESGQPPKSFGCETAWCNCGVLNGDGTWNPKMKSNFYFEYYNNNGQTPYIILMDKTRGALYQYVKMHRGSVSIVNFLNEDDKIDGGTHGNPPDQVQIRFFEQFSREHPDFKKMIDAIDKQYFD